MRQKGERHRGFHEEEGRGRERVKTEKDKERGSERRE